MNHTIHQRNALRGIGSPVYRAPSRIAPRGMRIGGWIVVGLSLAVVAAGIARWWLG